MFFIPILGYWVIDDIDNMDYHNMDWFQPKY